MFRMILASFFTLRGLKPRVNFFSPSGTNIYENVTKKRKIRILRFLNTVKLGSRQTNKTTQDNTFVIDIFKTFVGLKTCEGFEKMGR